jgi:excisionase family DNA binding protein
MLGVNPATLRQWTDAGRLGVYRTPGGHRRFSAAEVAALRRAPDAHRGADLPAALVAQLQARYRALGHSSSTHHGWLAELGTDTRDELRALGDELLAELGQLIGTPSPTGRRTGLAAARRIGARYAAIAARAGVDVGQIVEAYVMFRRPLLEVLANSITRYPETGAEIGPIMRRAERLMDEVLEGITASSTSGRETPHA